MSITVGLRGFDSLAAALRLTEKELSRAQINATNRAATAARKDFGKDASVTGIKAARIRRSVRIKRADNRTHIATLTPSSAGVDVAEYKWRASPPVDFTGTRAQILVRWIGGGEKVAAGFINPLATSGHPKALRSKNHRGRLARYEPAIGPSVAAIFKTAFDQARIERISDQLKKLFEEAVDKQIARRR